MKLISNTSFGDFCRSKRKEFKIPLDYYQWYNKVRDNYDEFLKQHLNLGMFFTCDDEGNFFEEPKIEDYFDDGFNFEFNQKHFKDVVLKEYYKAKEKVIFEGFDLNQKDLSKLENIFCLTKEYFQITFFTKEKGCFIDNLKTNKTYEIKTIEDLIQFELKLTESAIKQIVL